MPSAEPTDAAHLDNWNGGFYELSTKLGAHDDIRLETALNTLWQAAGLSQPFRRGAPGQAAEHTSLSAQSLLAGHLKAIAAVPGLGSMLCSVVVVREVILDSEVTQFGADWLDVCLPMGALGDVDRRVGAYPFGDTAASYEWREPVERWFEAIGRAVFRRVAFDHAVAGFEVSGVEVAEANGWVSLLRPTAKGDLVYEPVATW